MECIKTLNHARNVFMYFESSKRFRHEVSLNNDFKLYSLLEFEDSNIFEHYLKVVNNVNQTQEIESIVFEDKFFELISFFKEFDFNGFEFFEDETSFYALKTNEIVVFDKLFRSIQHNVTEYKIHKSHILTPVLEVDFKFILNAMLNSVLELEVEYSNGLPF